jgi:hypothetical protein
MLIPISAQIPAAARSLIPGIESSSTIASSQLTPGLGGEWSPDPGIGKLRPLHASPRGWVRGLVEAQAEQSAGQSLP